MKRPSVDASLKPLKPFQHRTVDHVFHRLAYSADVERRIRGSGTRIPTKWNARRSAATIGQPVTSISVATGCRYPTRDLV